MSDSQVGPPSIDEAQVAVPDGPALLYVERRGMCGTPTVHRLDLGEGPLNLSGANRKLLAALLEYAQERNDAVSLGDVLPAQ